MNQSLSAVAERLFHEKLSDSPTVRRAAQTRQPVHVVYGGANLFKADTIRKLGTIALRSLETFAPDFVTFADAMWLKGADLLPKHEELIRDLEFRLADNPERVRIDNHEAWLAWTIYNRVVEKLQTEPIEDFRIDFEDGYGIRPDAEEDAHAIAASDELAEALRQKTASPFIGFRVKSFQTETYRRAVRTLDLFLTNLLEKTDGALPENFVVTLPKITRVEEVAVLCELLGEFERRNSLPGNSIEIEIMIETPPAVVQMREMAEAAGDRLNSAHFGAFDYTAGFGIAATHQHLQHDACRFARQMMQVNLAPLGIRLSDSVTTEMPIPIHRGEHLTKTQTKENSRAVHAAWRRHFNNVTLSLVNGFYQSWDLHPNQLAARYAALYSFFLESADSQATRLRNFIGKATQAMLTGNIFDDAASAQGLLNFFTRAVSCGAMTEAEVLQKTGLTADELRSASFAEIMSNSRKAG